MANSPKDTHIRTILITGSSDGIGFETACQLAANEDENFVILHGRNNERVMKSADLLNKRISKDGTQLSNIGAVTGDFSNLNEVCKLANDVIEKYPSLNVLLCNAGIMKENRETSNDRLELTFQVNHLSHFLLVNKLLPTLKKNTPCRIINVSSICHSWHAINWQDLQAEKDYEKYEQYSRSKLMNHLFAFKLHRILQGSGITSNVLEPGVIDTKLLAVGGFSGSPIKQGAIATVKLCSDPKLENVSGKYFDNKGKIIESCKESKVENDQDRLWKLSQEMCEKFGFL